MTRKQMVLIIGVNAVISAVISLAVVLLVARPARVAATPTPTGALSAATRPVEVTSPTPEPVVHVVQSGDTISGLALLYDVPEEYIIAANQLANPNFLQVGMRLVIPVGGLPNVTATFTPAPTPTDTPQPILPPSAETATAEAEPIATVILPTTPTAAAGAPSIEITEIVGAGQVDQEQVRVTNTGDGKTDLEGWTLSDADGNIYTFHTVSLWPGGGVILHTRIGSNNPPTDFYWGKLEAVWSPGEVATLKDALGQEVATFVVGP